MRAAIKGGTFETFRADFTARMDMGDIEAIGDQDT